MKPPRQLTVSQKGTMYRLSRLPDTVGRVHGVTAKSLVARGYICPVFDNDGRYYLTAKGKRQAETGEQS